MSDALPTAEKVGRVLQFMAGTDKKIAMAKAHKEYVRESKARIIAIAKSESGAKSDAAAATIAYASDEYGKWLNDWKDAVYKLEELSAQRELGALNVDVWRSLNSARNKGQII